MHESNEKMNIETRVAFSIQDARILYETGWLPAFLPESKDHMLFYRALQSIRVDLSKFELSSENRRVLKKTSSFVYEVICKGDFEYDPIQVGKFCKDYFDEKFGKGVMSVSRIKRIFSAPMTTNIFKYYRVIGNTHFLAAELGSPSGRLDMIAPGSTTRSSGHALPQTVLAAKMHIPSVPSLEEEKKGGLERECLTQKVVDRKIPAIMSLPQEGRKEEYGGERVGYVTCYIDDEIFNYTFAFYDLKYYKENLGIRMMLDAVVWAKEQGKKYIYLGSVRDASGLYKTQFKGWEFWDGEGWSGDRSALKHHVVKEEN